MRKRQRNPSEWKQKRGQRKGQDGSPAPFSSHGKAKSGLKRGIFRSVAANSLTRLYTQREDGVVACGTLLGGRAGWDERPSLPSLWYFWGFRLPLDQWKTADCADPDKHGSSI